MKKAQQQYVKRLSTAKNAVFWMERGKLEISASTDRIQTQWLSTPHRQEYLSHGIENEFTYVGVTLSMHRRPRYSNGSFVNTCLKMHKYSQTHCFFFGDPHSTAVKVRAPRVPRVPPRRCWFRRFEVEPWDRWPKRNPRAPLKRPRGRDRRGNEFRPSKLGEVKSIGALEVAGARVRWISGAV